MPLLHSACPAGSSSIYSTLAVWAAVQLLACVNLAFCVIQLAQAVLYTQFWQSGSAAAWQLLLENAKQQLELALEVQVQVY